jgi:hypothetical protein
VKDGVLALDRGGALVKRCVILFLVALPFLAGGAAGCGKKGPPKPPRAVVPKAIRNLEAKPVGEAVRLTWSIPRKNTDGTSPVDLKGFKVLRSAIPMEKACEGCPKRFELLHDLDYQLLVSQERIQDRRVLLEDAALKREYQYAYKVISYNVREKLSPDSNIVEVNWDLPAAAPDNLRGRLTQDGIIYLAWDAPGSLADGSPAGEIAGYNVYRREKGQMQGISPLNDELVPELFYGDAQIEEEKDYVYTVRALRMSGSTPVESAQSEELSVSTKDVTPPQAPQGLVATPVKNGILLKWLDNTETDLLGYYVYRRIEAGEGFERITEEPLRIPGYLDTDTVAEKPYAYLVTAVDRSPRANESDPSEAAEVTVYP